MKYIKVITGMACFALFHILSYAQQSYYAEGTCWTELRLDTLKYNSWFTELREGGSTSYIPNYVRTDFYVKGDTTYMNSKYMKVWRHIEGQADSIVYLLCEEKNGLVLSSLSHRGGYGSILMPCMAYDFDWEVGKVVRTGLLPTAQLAGGKPYTHGIIAEIDTSCFGVSVPLTFVEFNGRTLIRGLGVTSWNGRDCVFGPTEAWYMEWQLDHNVSNDYRSVLVRFEYNGELLYDLWPNEKGELVARIPDVRETDGDIPVYDLKGCKVTGMPSRGIYIVGGQKRVVR